jgi:uncharacterized membrane protein YdjX (TVP38/TMEM64 family)
MRIQKKYILYLLVVIVLIAVTIGYGLDHYLTFENLKNKKDILLNFVNENYIVSVLLFIIFFLSTAFFVPGAIIGTIAGGFLYGVLMATLYVNIGSTAGATLAFLLSRHMIGKWIQQKYRDQLKLFNREIKKHGSNYLFTLRIIPVLPFFLTNYLAGLTHISVTKFIVTTSIGMVPGSIVYSYAGQQLSEISCPEDITSPTFIIALLLLALFALLPVLIHHLKKLVEKKG